MSALVGGLVIVAVTILVLEDLRVNYIFEGFMGLFLEAGLNEVVLLELEFSLSSDGALIKLLGNNVVFGVALEITFEVVAVHLLFLSESSKEVGVVLGPSLALSLEHALLSAFVILGVSKLSSVELLNLVESTIKDTNSLFNVVPSFVEILAIRSREIHSMLSKLAVNFSERLVHSIELFMSLLQSLQLVCRINKNTICFIRVNVNVDIGSGNSLQTGMRTVTEDIEEIGRHILLRHIELRDC